MIDNHFISCILKTNAKCRQNFVKFNICILKVICTTKIKKVNLLNGIGSHLNYINDMRSRLLKLFTQFQYIYVWIEIGLIYISVEYENGVKEFIQFAQRYEGRSDDEVKFRCPCVNCLNERKLNATQVREYLICDGFLRSYTIWTGHGELIDFPIVARTGHVVDSTMEER